MDRDRLDQLFEARCLPSGAFGAGDSDAVSAYRTFLGTLCLQMLGDEGPGPEAIDAIRGLRREDGGYAERSGDSAAQTNATAAAVALQLMRGGLAKPMAAETAGFLASMQARDGGLKAHADAAAGDLLSTFTGLLTICMLGAVNALHLGALARFLRSVARPGGGFGASPADAGADVEYTFYGMGCMALLRASVGEGG